MNTRHFALLGALGLTFGTGCSTLSLQRSQLDAVKTLAVVGYSAEVRLQDRNDGSGQGVAGIINTATAISDINSGEAQREREEQATETFDLLRAKVSEGTGWTVLARDEVTAHPAYQEVYEAHKSVLTGMSTTMGAIRAVPGMLMQPNAAELEPDERARLMDGLRVDALMLVRVSFVPGGHTGFSLGGIGKTGVLPKAIVDVTVWDRTSPEPIWRDSYAEGEPASVGVETTMGVLNDDQLTNGMTEAAQTAYAELMRRYKAGS